MRVEREHHIEGYETVKQQGVIRLLQRSSLHAKGTVNVANAVDQVVRGQVDGNITSTLSIVSLSLSLSTRLPLLFCNIFVFFCFFF
jgi:hypothetical protein